MVGGLGAEQIIPPPSENTVSLGRQPGRNRGCRSLRVVLSGDVPTPDLEIILLGLQGLAQVSHQCVSPLRVNRILLPHNLPPDTDSCHQRNCPSSNEMVACGGKPGVPGYPKSQTEAKWLRARGSPAPALAFYAQCDLPYGAPESLVWVLSLDPPTCRATPMSPVLLTSLRGEPSKPPSLSSLL